MRYQIWNRTDDIITPSGAQFTAEEWADRYPWAKIPGTKMIITAGVINGGAAMEFTATVEHYKKSGAAITEGMTDEEILSAIEDFEDNPPGANEPGTEERIAAALEAQVMMSEPAPASTLSAQQVRSMSAGGEEARSPAFVRVKRNFDRGLWGASMLTLAVEKGHITEAEGLEILESTEL